MREWFKAMDEEMVTVSGKKVWELVPNPEGVTMTENRCVYTLKCNEDWEIVI